MSQEALLWLHGSPKLEIDPWPKAEGITDPVQWVVMQEVVFHIDEKVGHTYFGIDRLVARTRYSEKTIRNALNDLSTNGYIKRWPKRGEITLHSVPAYREIEAPRGRSETGTPVGDTAVGATAPPVGDTAGAVGATGDSGRSDLQSRRQVEEKQIQVALKPPRGGESDISIHPSAPVTEAQLTFLHDIYVMTTGFPWTPEQRERERTMTAAEAREAIQFGWGDIEHEGRDNIAMTIPKGNLVHLSEHALAWLHGIPAKDAA